jgi:hypothetical protein
MSLDNKDPFYYDSRERMGSLANGRYGSISEWRD